jgi:nicotinamidase-related amidase
MKHAAVVLLGIALLGSTGCVAHRPMRINAVAPASAQLDPKAGDVVWGSDRFRIGRVEAVVPATAATAAHLVVRRQGRFIDTVLELVQHSRLWRTGFKSRIYVPTDATTKTVEGNVIINVPRIVVRKMPWKQPPARTAQEAKYGPSPDEVETLYGTVAPSLHDGRSQPRAAAADRPGMGTSAGETQHRDHEAQSDETYLPKGQAARTYPRERTALLIIDPVNDFLSEGGAAWELTQATVRKHNVVGNLKRVIEGARERGIPVLFGPMAYTEADYKKHRLHERSGINRVQFERKMFLAASWGADFHPELRPRDGETVLLPHKGIDVFMTDLPTQLERLGTTHLAIAGMTANLCIESTGRHAMEKGYDVTFVSNAIGADSHPSWMGAVHLNFPMIGNAVLNVDEFLAALDRSAAAARE